MVMCFVVMLKLTKDCNSLKKVWGENDSVELLDKESGL